MAPANSTKGIGAHVRIADDNNITAEIRCMKFTVFLASPNDASEERKVVTRALELLAKQERFKRDLHVDIQRWEDATISAAEDPQAAIHASGMDPREADLVIGILAYSLGSPLKGEGWQTDLDVASGRGRYRDGQPRTGTEWELDAALRAHTEARDRGHLGPSVLIFHLEIPHIPYDGEESPEATEARTQRFHARNRYLWDLKATNCLYAYEHAQQLGAEVLYHVGNLIDRQRLQSESTTVIAGGEPQVGEFPDRAPGGADDQPRRTFEGSNPYPGLRPYDEYYGAVYFGREDDQRELLRRVQREDAGFVCVSGNSGSGKSSLVRATLVATNAHLLGWTLRDLTPGHAPLVELAAQLLPEQDAKTRRAGCNALRDRLLTAPEATFAECLNALLARTGDSRLLLIVDQFEELFSVAEAEETAAFLRLLAASVRDGERVTWVGTLRADFLEAFNNHPALEPLKGREVLYLLYPLGRRGLKEAIERPLAAMGAGVPGTSASTLPAVAAAGRGPSEIEPALVDQLLEETLRGSGDVENLPLLNYTLHELYEQARRAGDRRLTRAHLAALAPDDEEEGIRAVLKQSADRAYASLAPAARRAAEHVFPALVESPRSGAEGWTRRRARKAELREIEGAEAFIDVFSRPRDDADAPFVPLLRTGNEGGEETVEVWHELLFRCWPMLKRWLDDRRTELYERDAAVVQSERWAADGYAPRYFRDWPAERLLRLRELPEAYRPRSAEALAAFLHPGRRLLQALADPALAPAERALVGDLLCGLEEDDRPGVGLDADGLPDLQWVQVPAGRVALEQAYRSPAGDQTSQDEAIAAVDVEPFAMAAYPITEAQFQVFVADPEGYAQARWWRPVWNGDPPSPETPRGLRGNFPQVSVAWVEAVAFCHWLSARLGREIRLPTEHEWQLAALGADVDGQRPQAYPWGGWQEGRANTVEAGIERRVAVGMFPTGARRPGSAEAALFDLCGNVAEWCINGPDSQAGKPAADLLVDGASLRAVRGGSFSLNRDNARSAIRSASPPVNRYTNIGFRVVCVSPIT